MQRTVFRIILSVVILIALNFVEASGVLKLALYLLPYFIAGYDILIEAFEGIREREVFDENFLMAVASIGALCLAFFYGGDYIEGIAVMLLYRVGELFEDVAEDRSRENIIALMDLRPDYANVEKDGRLEKISPEKISLGTAITVKPGEKIPIDGIIVEGHSNLDTRALTGENLPKNVKVDDEVLSGCINLSGVLKIRTVKNFSESTASKILELVENSSERKSKAEKFITRFAKIYTPAVCIGAVVLAVVPSLIFGNFAQWLYRALTFLVISCPCALVISVPLTFFAGTGGAGRKGILIKGANFIESLAKTSCAVFDKTGTLTKGVFEVTAVHPEILSENEILHIAAHVERYSSHPIADALRKAYPNEADNCRVEEIEEIAGYGVKAKVNGEKISLGNSKFMDSLNISWKPCERSGTIIHVAIEKNYAGHIVISDVVKDNSQKAVKALRDLGVERVVMLTGDLESSAGEIAEKLDIKEYYSGLLPADKVNKIEEFLSGKKQNSILIFVGDGINDAPVISRADVGIAMGALGSDAAIESADVVLMDDDPMKIASAIKISRKTMRIVKQNIYFSIGVKVLCLILGALGLANMWLAVFADVGVMVLAVMNAVRALFVKNI